MDYGTHFLYGGLSGACGIIVSQPFFTTKSFIQNKEGNFKDILIKCNNRSFYQNIKWLYSGWNYMILGASAEKMLVFGTYNSIVKYYNVKKDDYYKIAFAGYCSGIAASFASTPAEQIANDIRLNVHNYSLTHLYKGLWYTMMREKIGFAVYLTTFEYLQNKNNNMNVSYDSYKYTLLNASFTCIISWIIVCPLDVLKTLKQSGKKIIAKDILSGYRGFNFALARALPFHTTCLFMYEYFRNRQNNN